jgi:hypothetical protein
MSLEPHAVDSVVSGAAALVAAGDDAGYRDLVDSLGTLDHADAVQFLASATRAIRMLAVVLAEESGASVDHVLGRLALVVAGL